MPSFDNTACVVAMVRHAINIYDRKVYQPTSVPTRANVRLVGRYVT